MLAKVDDVETHLIVSGGTVTIALHELDRPLTDLTGLADVVHDDGNLAGSIASGSFRVDGMVVAPCSIKTLSGIANSFATTSWCVPLTFA